MKNQKVKKKKICANCKKNHKENKLKTFYGAYGIYCIPAKKYCSFKSKITVSKPFRQFLNIDNVEKENLFDEMTWRRNHFVSDITANGAYCRHRISGGCLKCFPDSYCGSIYTEDEEDEANKFLTHSSLKHSERYGCKV